jgi:enoyl-CoA hydratase/carnithine racemase
VGAVAHVRLDRPHVRNALNHSMMRQLETVLRELEGDPGVRVVVLSGSGQGFCAGWDRTAACSTPEETLAVDSLGKAVMVALDQMYTTLTVAAVRGATVGGGVLLAAACDFRVASEDAFVFMPEITFGNPLFWTGVSPLVREIGMSHTRYLVLSGMRMDAAWALRVGLFHEVEPVVDLEGRIETLVSALVEIPTRGVTLLKQDLACHAAAIPDGHPHTALSVLESLSADTFRAT